VADVACDEIIRNLRILARRETGKEPVVSMIVAFGFLAKCGDGVRLERRIDASRWSEI
jgi:hypothetical protein